MIEININPVAFTLGPFEVRWYGIMIALGVLTVVAWVLWQIKRGANISYDTAFTAALVGIPSGIIFSRLLHVIDNIVGARLYPYLVESGWVIDYLKQPQLIIGASGLTIWGAVLGAALGIWIYSRFANFKYGYFVDIVAPAIILGQAIGRVGCLINGCCYGYETSASWGIIYVNPNAICPVGTAVHPTQAYEIIYNLIVFGILLALRGRLKPDGSLFMVYLGLYSLWRVVIGFVRAGTPFLFGLQQAQVIGIIILLVVIPLLIMKVHWVRPGEEAPVSDEEQPA